MGNTAYGLPSKRLESTPKDSFIIPHKGIDCVSLRINGKHECYSCYHHAPMVIALLQNGDESISVDQWGVTRGFEKGVVCCVK
jgi:hypothetical protein